MVRSNRPAGVKDCIRFMVALALLLVWYQPGFGAQEPPATGASASPAYRLVGTIEGNPAVTQAVFEDPHTKTQKLYGIGDVVDGATIVEIKDHQVWLRRGEQIEVVAITGGSPVQRAPGDSIRVMASSDDTRQNLQGVLSQVIPPYDRRVEQLRHSLTRDLFDRFVGHFRDAGAPPKFVSTVAGPALSVADVDQQLLKHFGMEPTDLIIGVSGMGIDSQERLTQIWDIVSRAKVVDISVLRDDVVKPLYYTVH
jgi:hypothetical protein